jgi:hypothetical protein
VLVVAFAVGLISNIIQLHALALSQVDYMRNLVAELRTTEVFRGAPDMARNRYIDNAVTVPLRAKDYLAATHEIGSPVPPATLDTLRTLPPKAVDSVLVNLFGDALSFSADTSRSAQGMTCRDIESAVGSTVELRVPNGESLMLLSTNGGQALLSLGFAAPPSSDPIQKVQLLPETPGWVHVPDTGKPVVWQLRIQTGAVGMVRICGPS